MNELITLYNERIKHLENLMQYAEEEGRGDLFRRYYKMYVDLQNEMKEVNA